MRSIIEQDAILYLNENTFEDSSFVASLPDISEFQGYTVDQWKSWFISTSKLIMSKTSDNGVSIFYQSDIKLDGLWIDKGYLCQKAAEELGHNLIWHKIICRVPPGLITFNRPAYSHILCFSKNLRLDSKNSSPDVINHVGEKLWERGMGVNACLFISKFIKEKVGSKRIVNPFCGNGSLVSVAESFEFDVIGIERSPKRAQKSREIQFDKESITWKIT